MAISNDTRFALVVVTLVYACRIRLSSFVTVSGQPGSSEWPNGSRAQAKQAPHRLWVNSPLARQLHNGRQWWPFRSSPGVGGLGVASQARNGFELGRSPDRSGQCLVGHPGTRWCKSGARSLVACNGSQCR